MDNTSWPEAIIASTAIISGVSLVGVIVWQIGRIIQTGMMLGDRRGFQRVTGKSDIE